MLICKMCSRDGGVILVTALALLSSTADAAEKYHYEIRSFVVPADHFNYANGNEIQLRYLYNDTFVSQEAQRANNSAIFFYAGNEGDVEMFAQNTGFMWELAQKMGACVVFAEHRYYGQSVPAFCNDANQDEAICLQYLTVEQALEDFASLISDLSYDGQRPVIAFGGSYGGKLATWLRMKYPHLVEGALAASAPVWAFEGLNSCDLYAKITTSVFSTSFNAYCSINIQRSWNVLINTAATRTGREELNKIFKFCTPLYDNSVDAFSNYLENAYGHLAMLNYPYYNDFLKPLPAYPVREFCSHLHINHSDISLLKALGNAIQIYNNYTGLVSCLDYAKRSPWSHFWQVQSCNSLVVPTCANANNTMFRQDNWSFNEVRQYCQSAFGLRPRLNDMVLRYGGKKLKYASNIIFSNGLLDPWSGYGVLHALNKNIVVIVIPEGAHHIDLRSSDPADPVSVREARKKEEAVIRDWINVFYYNEK